MLSQGTCSNWWRSNLIEFLMTLMHCTNSNVVGILCSQCNQFPTPPIHGVWKSQKTSHSTLRTKRATFMSWVDKISVKMRKMRHLVDFQTLLVSFAMVCLGLTLNKLEGTRKSLGSLSWCLYLTLSKNEQQCAMHQKPIVSRSTDF